jgi:methionyl-tRNA synthetase
MNTHRYVTTSIPYVNAAPHVGFALELVQADVIARYHRLLGDDVRLQTGADENAFKNVAAARSRGIPVRALVDDNAARFRALTHALDISADRFQRTTDPDHTRAVHALFGRLRPDDVYQAEYRGLYCLGCEDFYLAGDAEDGRCPEHGTPLVEVIERNWFFRLSAYQEQLREIIATRRLRVIPESREREVLQFIDRGLSDISISRDATRAEGWGVPFPGDESQVVYVWIDALINYLSGLGFPCANAESRWSDAHVTHVIGKNVWKFHAVYWPALLLSAGVDVPDEIFVHGFLASNGRKIGKSLGNGIDPFVSIEQFGADGVRHFLLRHAHPFEDSDFTVARVETAYEADLANGIGNLLSRLTALAESAELQGVACVAADAPAGFHDAVRTYRFDLALATLWEEIASINRELGIAKPWALVKAGRQSAARDIVAPLVERLSVVSHWLAPFLPTTAGAIASALRGAAIRKCAPLFPRRG